MVTQEYVLAQEMTGDGSWLILRSDATLVFRIAADEAGFAREIYENLIAGRAWTPPLGERIEILTESLGDTDGELASSA